MRYGLAAVTGILVSGVWAATAHADNTDGQTVSVAGTVVAALEITASTDLRFGELVRANSAESEPNPTAVISVTDQGTGGFSIAYTGNGSPDLSETGTGTVSIAANGNRSEIGPAALSITGEPNFSYSVAAPSGIFAVMAVNDGASVSVDIPSASQTIGAGGTDTLYIGGTFSIASSTPEGAKSGTVDISVTYD